MVSCSTKGFGDEAEREERKKKKKKKRHTSSVLKNQYKI